MNFKIDSILNYRFVKTINEHEIRELGNYHSEKNDLPILNRVFKS
jgi:hypothetical protein